MCLDYARVSLDNLALLVGGNSVYDGIVHIN